MKIFGREFFKKDRIIQTHGKFIVQRKTCHGWEGWGVEDGHLWLNRENQLSYCSHETLDAARKFFDEKCVIKIFEVK